MVFVQMCTYLLWVSSRHPSAVRCMPMRSLNGSERSRLPILTMPPRQAGAPESGVELPLIRPSRALLPGTGARKHKGCRPVAYRVCPVAPGLCPHQRTTPQVPGTLSARKTTTHRVAAGLDRLGSQGPAWWGGGG